MYAAAILLFSEVAFKSSNSIKISRSPGRMPRSTVNQGGLMYGTGDTLKKSSALHCFQSSTLANNTQKQHNHVSKCFQRFKITFLRHNQDLEDA